ncbi:pyruvate dehydrogenase [Psychromarinibacter sp. C21-152]|uniref:Pyruvate dehydrogenase n=1 Tax=Psychromarinibacter sediminicola TaxID=3033385 RepID=A0AAE3NPS5_9RHOB|nr:biotin/lipoyl-containing protein [Psychromarinibacter sediminicola]MDF0600214.1 pyruvate dehydrogenase [Psychromarinibacter sediminicola]
MPHDVTMPQLGMAQDAGKIVSWFKAPGDAVAKGDALFEVETDKATMEVEAQAAGFLTGVTAAAGEDVPVGTVIARISDSAEDDSPAPVTDVPEEAPASGDLPEGHAVTMPQLGMAQDTGQLVSWLKAPGDAVAASDILFEVETDKSTMEVEAGCDGFLAATLAEAGEDVPVGDPVAIISADKPAAPVARSARDTPAPTAEPAAPGDALPVPKTEKRPAPASGPAAPPRSDGRILASPKARRLALEQGLDLRRLVDAGHEQPYHVRDLEALKALPSAAPAPQGPASGRRLTAETATDGLPDFVAWAAEAHGLDDADAILAGLAAASLPEPGAVAVERHGKSTVFATPAGRALSQVAATEDAPALTLRDLRGSPLRTVEMGGEATPVLTLSTNGDGLIITLECSPAHLDATAAIRLLSDFAGRVEQPLRHLL